tara:strand:- start:831 stop:1331 length:501 start_codon:yes stop_codon:yes gene_type:complete
MAFGRTPAGTIVRETIISTRRIPVKASTTITKGNVCELSSGYLIPCAASGTPTADVAHFVALETIDNSSGANGAVTAPVAISGHFVTVVADGAIRPGARVQISASTAGQVITAAGDIDIQVGTYYGKEGGIVSKSASTPFLESFTDDQDFPPVACADGDVIEVELI